MTVHSFSRVEMTLLQDYKWLKSIYQIRIRSTFGQRRESKQDRGRFKSLQLPQSNLPFASSLLQANPPPSAQPSLFPIERTPSNSELILSSKTKTKSKTKRKKRIDDDAYGNGWEQTKRIVLEDGHNDALQKLLHSLRYHLRCDNVIQREKVP